MRKYILKRLLQSIVILFFVAFIIYALMRCLPTSYVEAMARQKSMQPGSKSFEEWMEQLTAMYNMDGSIVSGYFKWLGSMFRGEFGDSWRWTVPVLQKFNDTVWLSFVMGFISFFFEVIIAIPLGIIAATKQYSKTDYTISVIALAGISLPTFFFASLLKLVFSVKLGWLPPFGIGSWKHWIMPIIANSISGIAMNARQTRSAVLETIRSDFVTTARAKGLPEGKVIYKHMLPNE